jgi:dienelactone hydrolase
MVHRERCQRPRTAPVGSAITLISDRPVRIFHGEDDNWTRIEPCRRYAERLRRAGADVQVIGFPGALHGFDGPGPPAAFVPPSVQNGCGCDFVEKAPGVLVFRDSGERVTATPPCVRRGATAGPEPRARAAAISAVKEFLTARFGLTPR